jgi:hypothetical protein
MFGMMEALLSFIRRQVGLRTDAASSTGSLHAKVGDLKSTLPNLTVAGLNKIVTASNNLKISDDALVILTNTATPTKKKEIVVLNLVGKIRVKFDLHSVNSVGISGKIYLNGTEVNNFTTDLDAWTTYSADISVKQGDLIQLYLVTGSTGSAAYAQNFRLYYDISANTDDAVVLL